jgi:protocatechuate 3,4-dioxygenase beta subunit
MEVEREDAVSDDAQVGRLLSRREALAVLGVTGAALLTGCSPPDAGGNAGGARETAASGASLPGCVVRPEQTLGPYFVETGLRRSDIRSDPSDGTVQPGVPLELGFRVSRIDASGCAPLVGAVVDIWQCDAGGVYSGVRDPRFDTRGRQFLRGHQFTDEAGAARFTTVYPGWYRGRAVHIHFRIRTEPQARRGHEFVSQLYFDDALTDRVHALPPYADRGPRDVRNPRDAIFRQGGEQLLLALTAAGEGYAGIFEVGLSI